MIKPGLERALKLCRHIPQPWKAIHVAGTNGKGSVCAFLTSALRSHGLKCGTFTSPHLIDKWDCVKINGSPVKEPLFQSIQQQLKTLDQDEAIEASEFELLTATAFQAFTEEDVDVAIVETGMGGKRDATNVLKHKNVCVITSIGLDHQEFLGNTLRDIAAEKCGIFQKDVDIVYEHSNHPDVIREIRYQANAAYAHPVESPWSPQPHYRWISTPDSSKYKLKFDDKFGRGTFLSRNALLAYRAAHVYLAGLGYDPDKSLLARSIKGTRIPGRMQKIDLQPVVGKEVDALMDGAHNTQAIEQLQRLGITPFREKGPIAWVFALSEGKDVKELFLPLIKPGDAVAAVEFGPVDGMSWKKPEPSQRIVETLREALGEQVQVEDFGERLSLALRWAANETPGTKSVAVVGSLYLASDVLRLLRSNGQDTESMWHDPYVMNPPFIMDKPKLSENIDQHRFTARGFQEEMERYSKK